MLNSFLWCSIKWLAWEKLTVNKEGGVFGFRDLYAFNLVMLGKQAGSLFLAQTKL